jgi:hypothetical protein
MAATNASSPNGRRRRCTSVGRSRPSRFAPGATTRAFRGISQDSAGDFEKISSGTLSTVTVERGCSGCPGRRRRPRSPPSPPVAAVAAGRRPGRPQVLVQADPLLLAQADPLFPRSSRSLRSIFFFSQKNNNTDTMCAKTPIVIVSKN